MTDSRTERHFNQWVESVNGSRVHTRYAHCIYVDQEVIDSVLEGGEPGSWASEDVHDPRAFVKILDWQFEQDEDDEDDGEEPVEVRPIVKWLKEHPADTSKGMYA